MGQIAYLNMYVLTRRETTHSKVMRFLLRMVLLCHATALVGCESHLCGFSVVLKTGKHPIHLYGIFSGDVIHPLLWRGSGYETKVISCDMSHFNLRWRSRRNGF